MISSTFVVIGVISTIQPSHGKAMNTIPLIQVYEQHVKHLLRVVILDEYITRSQSVQTGKLLSMPLKMIGKDIGGCLHLAKK
tara:strand:+ start:919 stop:1164 length:246 start_codon:yes stop_codon:yes gene_type:complete